MLLVALWSPASAEPWDDPAAVAVDERVREASLDVFLGAAPVDPVGVARLAAAEGIAAGTITPVQEQVAAGGGWWVVRPSTSLDVGSLAPVYAGGDTRDGWASLDVSVAGHLAVGPLTVVARPTVEGAAGPLAGALRADEAWLAVGTPGAQVGFGTRDRWYGPPHHGTLTLSDNAAPPWMGWIAGEGRWKGKASVLGRFRGELDVGFLDRPRTDVTRPGFLALDLRWLPWRCVEIGATRMTLFGGVDRPPVNLGQLLVPTEPHVYDDPDLSEADQNELAALDFRVTLPLARWWGLPLRYVEGWWQYGGEDVIARKAGGIPYPSLAGVANIYGLAAATGPLRVEVEHARLMDDYFRWYVGHRVYHAGFTQDGRSMGHHGGTDSATLWGAVSWEAPTWRARLSAEHLRRVGVIEALNDKLFAFGADESHHRFGVAGGMLLPRAGWAEAEVEVDRVTGVDFVPGAAATRWRVAVRVEPLALAGRIGSPR